MATISPGEGLVTISSGTVHDDDWEDIFLSIRVNELNTDNVIELESLDYIPIRILGEFRQEEMWYMQKEEAECVISALKVALSHLE